MNDDHEDLSRLLAGELPPERAAELRVRIDADPELARVWAAMQALPADLADLPDSPPPQDLDDAVLGEPSAPANRGSWTPWIIAAAAALFALWPSTPAEVLQTQGVQLVQGDVVVLAGDIEVEVHGAALISVEPPPGFAREMAAGGPDMDRKHLLAALAGAAVTITLYEGTAAIHGGSDAHAHLEPGETWESPAAQVDEGASAEPQVHRAKIQIPLGDEDGLRRELARLQGELAQLEFAHGLTKGQLTAVQGEPNAWPDEMPASLEPDQFEQSLRAALGDRTDADILSVDCSEYPCLAVIQSFSESDDWVDELESVGAEMERLAGSDDFGIMNMAGEAKSDDETPVRMLGVGYLAGGDGEDAMRRANFRGQEMLQDAMHDAMHDAKPEGADEEDVERR